MTSGNAWRAAKAAGFTLTPLNLATTAAFRSCQTNGGHVRGEGFVDRDGLRFPLCRSCGVPIRRGKPKNWNGASR